MYSHSSRFLWRRGFCSCCAVAASLAVNRRWLLPAEAYAEAPDIVDTIRDAAATAPLQLHKLRGNVTVIEGSGGNIAVLTGADGKVFVDAGIAATRPRVLDAANSLSQDPIKHLINTHWHFDLTDGNQWLNEQAPPSSRMKIRTSIFWRPRGSRTGSTISPHRHWPPCRRRSSPPKRRSASTDPRCV